MSKDATIGLVVPFAEDKVPDEGRQMYPDARFLPRGVGVRSLTPEGFAAAFDAIIPAADHLAAQGVDAIMVVGTSLTFYRGAGSARPVARAIAGTHRASSKLDERCHHRWLARRRRQASGRRHRL